VDAQRLRRESGTDSPRLRRRHRACIADDLAQLTFRVKDTDEPWLPRLRSPRARCEAETMWVCVTAGETTRRGTAYRGELWDCPLFIDPRRLVCGSPVAFQPRHIHLTWFEGYEPPSEGLCPEGGCFNWHAFLEAAALPVAGEPQPSRPCHDCGVAPGQYHRPGCDVEQCPTCGRQLLTCGCDFVGGLGVPPLDDRMPWKGIWPGEEECREWGWYCLLVPGRVPCGADDPGASCDFARLKAEAVWDRDAKRFVRRADQPAKPGRPKRRRRRPKGGP
jgi:hypothetical protein